MESQGLALVRQGLARPASHDISREEVTWVHKRYNPIDMRLDAPVPRYKLITPSYKCLPPPEQHWVPPKIDSSPWAHSRVHEEKGNFFPSQRSTRCQEWSTLRQMLPSGGRPHKVLPPSWGSGFAPPPLLSGEKQRHFPHINSPMTRFVDDMHKTDRLFRLY